MLKGTRESVIIYRYEYRSDGVGVARKTLVESMRVWVGVTYGGGKEMLGGNLIQTNSVELRGHYYDIADVKVGDGVRLNGTTYRVTARYKNAPNVIILKCEGDGNG